MSKSVAIGSRDVTVSLCPTNLGILCPVWGSSVQDTDILGEGPVEGHRDDERAGM